MMDKTQRLILLNDDHIVIDKNLLLAEFEQMLMLSVYDNKMFDRESKKCNDIAYLIKRCQVTKFHGVRL
mgnify:CR=1 FL=1